MAYSVVLPTVFFFGVGLKRSVKSSTPLGDGLTLAFTTYYLFYLVLNHVQRGIALGPW